MNVPYSDPSLPASASPLFADTDAARGDQLRANNGRIWGNFVSLFGLFGATGKALDSEKVAGLSVGNASGNIPLSNLTENSGLISQRSRLLFNRQSSDTNSILDMALSDFTTYGNGLHYYSIPSSDPARPWTIDSQAVLMGYPTFARLIAFKLNSKAIAIRLLLGGTWETAWTYLTDDNGNALISDTLYIPSYTSVSCLTQVITLFSAQLNKRMKFVSNCTDMPTGYVPASDGALIFDVFYGGNTDYIAVTAWTTNNYKKWVNNRASAAWIGWQQLTDANGAAINAMHQIAPVTFNGVFSHANIYSAFISAFGAGSWTVSVQGTFKVGSVLVVLSYATHVAGETIIGLWYGTTAEGATNNRVDISAGGSTSNEVTMSF